MRGHSVEVVAIHSNCFGTMNRRYKKYWSKLYGSKSTNHVEDYGELYETD